MRHAIILPLLALCACNSESRNATRELEMIYKANGSGDEKCAAKGKLANAYLHEGNQKEYENAKLTADIYCQGVSLDKQAAGY
ncbi:hypothetical protein [Sphingomonas aracearum]|uniref:hypothetical protein n=1 Tax=Sphingomonas aracearum TaxID=2283317 RepID=UPI0011C04EEF|nr:hypothetical protein [Sphingomonas aracearum]